MLDLEYYTNNDVNLVEIYLIKSLNENSIDVNIDSDVIENIKKKYTNWKRCEYVVFNRNKMAYTYDKSTDNQIMSTKELVYHNTSPEIAILAYKYSKLPTYLFPCTHDIDEKLSYEVEECRITNRISLIIKNDKYASSVFIEYKHSSQAENEKNESILKTTIYNITNAKFS